MVRRQQTLAPQRQHLLHNQPHPQIYRLHRMHPRLHHPSMPHHVRIRKIHDHRIILLQLPPHLERQIRRTHLRLLVIRRHFLRTDRQIPVLTRKRRVRSSIEEECHMRKLLRLRRSQLPQPSLRQHFPKYPLHALRPEHRPHPQRRIALLVLRQRITSHPRRHLALERIKTRIHQRLRQLPRTVRTEIEPQHHIPVPHPLLASLTENHRLQKLITTRLPGIRRTDRRRWSPRRHRSPP